MNGVLADPLAQLRDLHLPEPVGLWPPAPGWYLLAGLLGLMLLAAAWSILRRRRSLGHRALAELGALEANSELVASPQTLAAAVSELLRRVALQRFERDRVASLHGAAWREFLTQTKPGVASGFEPCVAQLIAVAPYAPAGTAAKQVGGALPDAQDITGSARAWIRRNA